MARFCTLCSSSSGNSTYIGTPESGVLIDAGTNCKQLLLSLERASLNPDSIKAVFVTHEHTDHTGALRVFAAKKNIPVFASAGTLSALAKEGIINGKFPCEEMPGDGIEIDGMYIERFKTSHDSVESCGYTVNLPDRKIGVATDTGTMTDEILSALSGCDLVLIESNYDEELLKYGPYPPYLKSRIRSSTGHLSNPDCAKAVCALYSLGVRRFVLGHLSRENNTPDRAFSCINSALTHLGAKPDRDYTLSVAPVSSMQEFIVF